MSLDPKTARAFAVFVAVVLILVACSPTPAPTPAPTQTSSLTPTGLSGLSGDLTVWQTYGSGTSASRGDPAAFNAALDIVRAENPALRLTVIEVSLGDLFRSYQLQAASGVPDLFIAPNDSTADLARAGLALDLQGHMTDADLARFSPLALNASTVDGVLVQVPESLNAVAIYYDTASVPSFPATTDELLAKVADGSIRLGLYQAMYHMFGWWGSFGGRLMDDSGLCIADTTPVGDAFAYYAALKEAGATWYAGADGYANMAAAFDSGEIDAIIDGPWEADKYRRTHPDNLGVAPIPDGPGGSAAPLTGVDGWTINPNSANVDLAVAFAKRMTQPDVLKTFADLADHIPANPGVVSADPLAAQFAAAIESGVPRPQVPQLAAFWGNFGDALDAVIDEGADPGEAVAQACAAMNLANGL